MIHNSFRSGGLFKGGIFILALLLVLATYFYIQRTLNGLRAEAREIMDLYANIYAQVPSLPVAELSFLFNEVVLKTNFPIVITGVDNEVQIWKGIDVDPDDRSPEALKRVAAVVVRMDYENTPIPMHLDAQPIGYLHYADTLAIKSLGILPWLQVGGFLVFIAIGVMGFNNIRRSEQRFIWVGMAKEMAHQLGTPISSLMGWSELLRTQEPDREKIRQTADEMDQDIQRLSKIAARFSRIGSTPELKLESLQDVLGGVVAYFRKRLPQFGKEVDITVEIADDVPDIFINRELFEWVVENLIKNGLDAIEDTAGAITIIVSRDATWKFVLLDVRDTGKGIPRKHFKDVFRPGFSTKARGWGLGLSLAKRIVEEYHGARLIVRESRVGEGTTMRLTLPI